MEKKRKLQFKIVGLVCTLTGVIISAANLISRENDALVIGLCCGAFLAGLVLANLISDARGNGLGGRESDG